MKKALLSILGCLLAACSYSQNTCFIGNKSYKCTDTYIIGVQNLFNKNPEICFFKDGEKGIIAFKVNNYMMPYTRVKNKLILYLDNNQIVTCVDRGRYDIIDDYATTLYYLTKEEMIKLRRSNISKIRYTIGDNNGLNMNYSVVNEDFEDDFSATERLDFPSIVNYLFE